MTLKPWQAILAAGAALGATFGAFLYGEKRARAAAATGTATKSGFGEYVPRQLSANSNATGTTLSMKLGDTLRTSLPVSGSGQAWTFATTGDSLVASGAASTTQNDPSLPGGTVQIDTWTTADTGTTVLTGTLPNVGNKAILARIWRLTITVTSP